MVAHARIQLRIELLKKSFLLQYDTGKLRSKFGEDRSTNNVTILSTDAGRLGYVNYLSTAMHCIGQTITHCSSSSQAVSRPKGSQCSTEFCHLAFGGPV